MPSPSSNLENASLNNSSYNRLKIGHYRSRPLIHGRILTRTTNGLNGRYVKDRIHGMSISLGSEYYNFWLIITLHSCPLLLLSVVFG